LQLSVWVISINNI